MELFYLHDWNVIYVPDGKDFRQIIAAQRLAACTRNHPTHRDRLPHREGMAVRDRGARVPRGRPRALLRGIPTGPEAALGRPFLADAVLLRSREDPLLGLGRHHGHGGLLLGVPGDPPGGDLHAKAHVQAPGRKTPGGQAAPGRPRAQTPGGRTLAWRACTKPLSGRATAAPAEVACRPGAVTTLRGRAGSRPQLLQPQERRRAHDRGRRSPRLHQR